MTTLNKLTNEQAIKFILWNRLDEKSWPEYAATCLKHGIDYNCRELTKHLKNLTGRDYYLLPGINENNDCAELFRKIEHQLTVISQNNMPTEDDIYNACGVIQHQSDADEMWYDLFALVLCNEYGVEFNEEKFDKIFNGYQEEDVIRYPNH